MTEIEHLLAHHGSDKCTVHSYGDFYDQLLTPLRGRPITMLEVGVAQGGSLKAWAEYLPLATIIGLDNYAKPIDLSDRVKLVHADSTDLEQVNAALGDLRFDLIVDDGSHWIKDQIPTWMNLWPRLLRGTYVVEDIQRIDEARPNFEPLGFEFLDLREKKGRGDDVIAFMRKCE